MNNPGNFTPYQNDRKIPDYATKDYVYCDLCKLVERIPKMGDSNHWRGLWPLSLEEIAENGVNSYEYHDEELRQEIIDKLKKDIPPEVKKTENILEQLHRTTESAGFHIIPMTIAAAFWHGSSFTAEEMSRLSWTKPSRQTSLKPSGG
jgi:hypothetical protein